MTRPTEVPRPGVVELSDADAPEFLERNKLVALLFVAGVDEASQRMRTRVALVQAKMDVAAGVLDVDAHRLVAQALGVKSVPALLVFEGGELVDRVMGTPPEGIIEDTLRTRLGKR